MASLRMLSSVDEIARVSRKEYSHIAQPTGEDEVWVRGEPANVSSIKA